MRPAPALAAPLSLACALALGLFTSACSPRRAPLPADPALVAILNAQDTLKDIARKYVVKGRDGHLFYLEEVRAAVSAWTFLDSNAALIGNLAAALEARGVRLLVVPAPTKVETYPEYLGARDVPEVGAAKGIFFNALDANGAEYLDLRAAFFSVKKDVRLFAKTDTHWDAAAIELAAEAISKRIGVDDSLRTSAWTTWDTVIAGFQGDLAEKFGAPDIHGLKDTIRVRRVLDAAGATWVEPDSARVILYGDSYLNQYKSLGGHLGAHLARCLGEPVKTVYSLAGFTDGPRKMRDLAEAFPDAKVVVWVFTSRTLMEAAR